MSSDPNQAYPQPPAYGAPGGQGYPPPAGGQPIGYPPGGVEYPPDAMPPPQPSPQPYPVGGQPYPAPPPGAYPQYYAGPMAPSTNGMAIASLACSIGSFIILPVVGAILGVIFGHIALGQIRRANPPEQGEGLAKAGLIVGYIHLGLFALAIIALVVFLIIFAAAAATTQPAFVQ